MELNYRFILNMETIYKDFQESLQKVIGSIRKEIVKGSIDSHVALQQEGDSFSLITTLKGKSPMKKTWMIPQEDRDEYMTLLHQIDTLKKSIPFARLLQAIRSTRHMIHGDEVWKKNIVSFLGESYTLDAFMNAKRSEADDIQEQRDDIKIHKAIQNRRDELNEKNIIVQSLWQTLILKDRLETGNIKQYLVLSELLREKKVIHEVKGGDNSITFVKDGEPIMGDIQGTYRSLKEYDTVHYRESLGEDAIGKVSGLVHYKRSLGERTIKIVPLGSVFTPETTHFIVANTGSRASIGQGPYEAYVDKEGVQPLSNASVRSAMVIRSGGLPVVVKGKLYRSMIAAIMSYKVEHLALGEIHEDMNEDELWANYIEQFDKKGDVRRTLLKAEYDVMVENWNIRTSDYSSLKSLHDVGMSFASFCVSSDHTKLYAHHNGVYNLVMKKAHCQNANAGQNQSVMLSHILNTTDWIDKLKRDLRLGVKATWRDIVNGIETLYGINLKKHTLDGGVVMEDWVRSYPMEWDTPSLQASLDAVGFESPRVSSLELVSFLEQYATPILRELQNHSDEIKERDGNKYGVAIVLGHFLSILHPTYKTAVSMNLELVDAYTKEVKGTVQITKQLRQVVRNVMDRNSLGDFELEQDEEVGVGASERKEEVEISDLEQKREDREDTLRICVDRGMSIRIMI